MGPYKFGTRSMDNLSECHSDLQKIAHEAIKIINFSVIEGYRSDIEQQKLFDRKMSKLGPGKSKHNRKPSLAYDFIPYPFDGNWSSPDLRERLIYIAGVKLGIASSLGINARWGGDWNRNGLFDQSFIDMPHIELIE